MKLDQGKRIPLNPLTSQPEQGNDHGNRLKDKQLLLNTRVMSLFEIIISAALVSKLVSLGLNMGAINHILEALKNQTSKFD